MKEKTNRRDFLRSCSRNTLLLFLGGVTGLLGFGRRRSWTARYCRPGSRCGGCSVAGTCGAVPPVAKDRVYAGDVVWQIDPDRCTQCGQCATQCVLSLSAVKCLHTHAMCGYCRLCFGYFQAGAPELTAAAENQLCPTGAIRRKFVEEPYYEYTIDHDLCIGCGKCVKGCNTFGNGSLYLQVDHSVCLNCNDCAIARTCPSDAFVRVPAKQAYLPKGGEA